MLIWASWDSPPLTRVGQGVYFFISDYSTQNNHIWLETNVVAVAFIFRVLDEKYFMLQSIG